MSNKEEFSDIVYKCPGDHQRKGGTFSYMHVQSQEEKDEALSDGWFDSLPEAINGKSEDMSPPTRSELEAKAKELGLKYTAKTTDVQLAEAIAAKLG